MSLANRLALLFAACTAAVALLAGALFSRASEMHFIELDQQQLQVIHQCGERPASGLRLQPVVLHGQLLQAIQHAR